MHDVSGVSSTPVFRWLPLKYTDKISASIITNNHLKTGVHSTPETSPISSMSKTMDNVKHSILIKNNHCHKPLENHRNYLTITPLIMCKEDIQRVSIFNVPKTS
jgi:hypothetical protein